MFSEIIMPVLELIGTVSFAVSGAFVAIKARLDLLGVLFVGVITAVGGGIVRDVLIGHFPASVFTRFPIFVAAACAAAAVFVVAYVCRRFDVVEGRIEHINSFFDAVGLAAFSVMGTEVSFSAGFADNVFFSVVLGTITGVGGGIFRDILTDTTPYIFKKHVYALASILGSILYYLLRRTLGAPVLASAAAMALVVVLRLLAAKYHWSLPKVHLGTAESADRT